MIWLPRTTDNSTYFAQSLEIRGIESRLYIKGFVGSVNWKSGTANVNTDSKWSNKKHVLHAPESGVVP